MKKAIIYLIILLLGMIIGTLITPQLTCVLCAKDFCPEYSAPIERFVKKIYD